MSDDVPEVLDRAQWAERLRGRLTAASSALLDLAHDLLAAREQLPHGEWLAMLRQDLHFSARWAQQLVSVARHEVVGDRDAKHAAHLPRDLTSLVELARLPPEQVRDLIDSEALTPEISRPDVKALVRHAREHSQRKRTEERRQRAAEGRSAESVFPGPASESTTVGVVQRAGPYDAFIETLRPATATVAVRRVPAELADRIAVVRAHVDAIERAWTGDDLDWTDVYLAAGEAEVYLAELVVFACGQSIRWREDYEASMDDTPERRAGDAVLADGEWHERRELLKAAMDAIPGQRAMREYREGDDAAGRPKTSPENELAQGSLRIAERCIDRALERHDWEHDADGRLRRRPQ